MSLGNLPTDSVQSILCFRPLCFWVCLCPSSCHLNFFIVDLDGLSWVLNGLLSETSCCSMIERKNVEDGGGWGGDSERPMAETHGDHTDTDIYIY